MTCFESNHLTRTTRMRRGFSFVEVLFAVMILGIGFIMIAGVFPVAIAQTQTNGEESVGAALARSAASYLSTIPFSSYPGEWPGTAANDVKRVDTTIFGVIRGNVISPEDPRYAWVALYRRAIDPPTVNSQGQTVAGAQSSTAQVYIIVVRCRNRPGYDNRDISGANPTLMAQPISATLAGDKVTIQNGSGTAACAAPGAFFVATDGRVFKLGVENNTNATSSTRNFGLVIGNRGVISGGGPYSDTVNGWIVGQGLRNPGQPYDANSNPYEGGAQDIMVYTTFIPML